MAILFFDMLKNKIDMTKSEAAVRRAEKQDNKRFRQAQTFSDRQVTISTKAELEDAVSKRYGTIIVVGELAKHVSAGYKAKHKLAALEKAPPVVSAGALVAVGITESIVITAIIALAVILVVALFKNYDIDTDIQITSEQGELQPKLKLKLLRKMESQ
ncbi:hypothetical protein [Paenibacillus donghaensis]|uniref:Uncharacterized protein n=1 Tax=Paenibacillus donghaensis TaxID=414771 RepID=A0A2Z2KFK2_9BACL|nr:hypothetical protein [Paenibacillus donghaensis]ASA24924.1 hypothetical protein B9T62_31720 [Paenibacillus donghaensis]